MTPSTFYSRQFKHLFVKTKKLNEPHIFLTALFLSNLKYHKSYIITKYSKVNIV